MKPIPLAASLLAATVLLTSCDDAALRGWNKVFGDDKKARQADAATDRAPAKPAIASRKPERAPDVSAPAIGTAPPPAPLPVPTAERKDWPMAPTTTTTTTQAAAPATVAVPEPTQAFAFDSSDDGSNQNPGVCGFPGLSLPPGTKVFAAGAYGGRDLDYQIDQSGHQATRIDVAVNQRNAPVVLLLGAYEPTVWNVGWAKGTRILAVVVGGYHRQAIAGLPATVPVLVSTYDNKGSCGYFYVNPDDVSNLNPMALRTFGRRVDRVYPAASGRVVVGDALVNVEMVTVKGASADAFRNPNASLAGPAGIEQAVRQGLLRGATAADLAAWRRTLAATRDLPPVEGARAATEPSGNAALYQVYVVNKSFKMPSGLYGAHAVTLIVPRGVARPTGELGHSQILDYNTMGCVGLTCGR